MRLVKLLIGVLGLAVIGLFFLPWLGVSLDAQGDVLTVRGVDLALGNVGDVSLAKGDFELLLIPAFTLLGLVFAFIEGRILKGLYLGAIGSALLVLGLYGWQLEGDIRPLFNDFLTEGDFAYQIGWWLTVVLLVVLAVLGIVFRNPTLPSDESVF
jgi:hypothetical protein